jgi:hypothetical protein
VSSLSTCYTRAVLTVLADCIVPIQCVNPRADYSTASPPTLDYWVAALLIVIGFALAGMLIVIRRRM